MLGGLAAKEGMFGMALESGVHHGRLHARVEGGDGLLTGGPAGPAPLQRARGPRR